MFTVFRVQSYYFLVKIIPRYFILFGATVNILTLCNVVSHYNLNSVIQTFTILTSRHLFRSVYKFKDLATNIAVGSLSMRKFKRYLGFHLSVRIGLFFSFPFLSFFPSLILYFFSFYFSLYSSIYSFPYFFFLNKGIVRYSISIQRLNQQDMKVMKVKYQAFKIHR